MSSAPVRAYGLSLSSFETAIKIFSCLSSKNCHNSPSRRSIPQKPVLNEGHRYKLLPAAVGPLFTDTLTSKKTDGLGSASQQLFKPAFAQRQNYCTGVNLGQGSSLCCCYVLTSVYFIPFLAHGHVLDSECPCERTNEHERERRGETRDKRETRERQERDKRGIKYAVKLLQPHRQYQLSIR